jgi:hypothetical protein
MFSTSLLNGELELPLTEAGTDVNLRGELWDDLHPPIPVKLARGESKTWTYNLAELFQRVTNRSYRIEFIPSGLDGFGSTNPVGQYAHRYDLACSNLFIKIKK